MAMPGEGMRIVFSPLLIMVKAPVIVWRMAPFRYRSWSEALSLCTGGSSGRRGGGMGVSRDIHSGGFARESGFSVTRGLSLWCFKFLVRGDTNNDISDFIKIS